MRTLLAVCLLAPLAGAQSLVHTVGGTAPDFAELDEAVQAAADGDVLLVRPGSYGPFELTGKGLTVLFDHASHPGAEAVVEGGRVVLRDVPPGSLASLTGLTLRGGVAIESCDGPVFLQDVAVGHVGLASRALLDEPAVDVLDSAAVHLARLQVDGLLAVSAMRVRGSTCAVWNSAVVGGKGFDGDQAVAARSGHPALESDSSDVFVALSVLRGGEGGDGGGLLCHGGTGGVGLSQVGASTRTEARDASFEGGAPGASLPGCSTSALHGQPLAVSGGTLQILVEGVARGVDVPRALREGERASLDAYGTPGAAAFWIATLGRPRSAYPSLVTGPLVDPDPPLLRYLGRSDAFGFLEADLGPVPDLRGLQGLVTFQQVVFLSGRTLRATDPVQSVLLDASL